MSTDSSAYTLGQLILELEGSERAYQDNIRTADRIEEKDGNNIASTWWRIQAAALLFQPDLPVIRASTALWHYATSGAQG